MVKHSIPSNVKIDIEDDGRVGIQGIVSEPISGIDAGRIDNGETAGRAIKIAKERIESELNIKITEAYAGLSGDFVRCVQVTDYVYVQDDLGNGSNQITNLQGFGGGRSNPLEGGERAFGCASVEVYPQSRIGTCAHRAQDLWHLQDHRKAHSA